MENNTENDYLETIRVKNKDVSTAVSDLYSLQSKISDLLYEYESTYWGNVRIEEIIIQRHEEGRDYIDNVKIKVYLVS